MREYTDKPQSTSRTLDGNPQASKQAPISAILQAYKVCRDETAHSGQLKSATIQRHMGSISPQGLTKEEIGMLIVESESTKFDMRGHAFKRHGSAVTDKNKMDRIIGVSSSFDSDSLLKMTVAKALKVYIKTINAWLESSSDKNLVLDIDMTDELGKNRFSQLGTGMIRSLGEDDKVDRRSPPQKIGGFTHATVILRKSEIGAGKKGMQRARDTAWHLLTAFPVPSDL